MSPVVGAFAAGLLSALFYLSVLTGNSGAAILFVLTPLPVLAAGLSAGVATAAIAAGAASLAVGAIAGLVSGGLFLAIEGLPALLLVRQAMLARSRPNGGSGRPNGGLEWYPPGRLVMVLAGLGLAALAAGAVLTADGPDGFAGWVRSRLTVVMTAMLAEMPDAATGQGAGPMAGQAVGLMVDLLAPVFPGVMVAYWLATLAVNAALAQGMLMRFGRNGRPPMRVADTELPGWAPLLLAAVGLAALVLPGTAGYLAGNALLVLAVPFFCAGLAVVHAFVHGRSGRALPLVVVWLLMLLFAWPILLVIGLGVFEHWVGLRARFARTGPDQED